MFISPVYVILAVTLGLSTLKPNNKVLLGFNILFMFFLAIFRDITVGTDTLGYYDDYVMIHSFDDEYKIYHDFESGFIALIVFFKSFITQSYLPFVSLIFFPFFIGLLHFVRYKCVSLPLALFFMYMWGLYFQSYNIMRQMMVIGLIFMNIHWLYESKYWKFAIWVVSISLLFHRSGITTLLFIPLHYWITVKSYMPSKKVLYILIIISFSVYFVGKTFLQGILSPIIMLYDRSYLGYLTYENESSGYFMAFGNTMSTCLMLYIYKKGRFNFEMIGFIIGIIIFNFMNAFSANGVRLATYWIPFGLIVFPYVLSCIAKGNKKEKFCIVIILLYLITLFVNNYYIGNINEVNPYILRDLS